MAETFNFVFRTPQGTYTSNPMAEADAETFGGKVTDMLRTANVGGYLRFAINDYGGSVFLPLALLRLSSIEIVVKNSA